MNCVELQDRLQALCPYPLSLELHEKQSTYASIRRDRGGKITLSLHSLFLHSPTPIIEALARFAVRPDRASRSMIRQMAYLYFTQIKPPIPDFRLSQAQGDYVDLQVLYDRMNCAYFNDSLRIPIAWGARESRARRFRHITFGSYHRTKPLIRINRLLDHPEVPLPFTEFIVYHEMLHGVCPAELDGRGRLFVHTEEFHRREKLHPHYAFAQEWKKSSLQFFKALLHNSMHA